MSTFPQKTKAEEALEESYYKDFASQVERLDKFAMELIKLQLAIPAIYAAALKLSSGSEAENNTLTLGIVFSVWVIALVLSFFALMPKKYGVNPDFISEQQLANVSNKDELGLSIEAFFRKSASHKFTWLAASCLFSVFGLALAVFSSLF